VEEHKRLCCPGAEDGIWTGIAVGLGPVLKFGPQWMQGDLAQSILLGDKVISLAITEPYAGSDVAGVLATAVKSRDGSHYVVNGTKKWSTNSVFADYFTTLVRLGTSKDLAMLLIPRTEGVTTRSIPTDYGASAGTGLISFENVVVPADHLLGKEGDGMKLTMHNFNLERLAICAGQLCRSRRVIEECFLWANQREVFGKKLIEQPVIRNHLADMLSDYQAAYALYEKTIIGYVTASPEEVNAKMGGPQALLKYRVTRMTGNVSDKAVQIFGGRAVTKTGMGKNISRCALFLRTYVLACTDDDARARCACEKASKRRTRWPRAFWPCLLQRRGVVWLTRATAECTAAARRLWVRCARRRGTKMCTRRFGRAADDEAVPQQRAVVKPSVSASSYAPVVRACAVLVQT